MAKGTRYQIEYEDDAERQLRDFRPYDKERILEEIDMRLQYQPNIENTNRKLMRENDYGTWELRIMKHRVFYDIEDFPEAIVYIRNIGIKRGNRLYIDGQEVDI